VSHVARHPDVSMGGLLTQIPYGERYHRNILVQISSPVIAVIGLSACAVSVVPVVRDIDQTGGRQDKTVKPAIQAYFFILRFSSLTESLAKSVPKTPPRYARARAEDVSPRSDNCRAVRNPVSAMDPGLRPDV